MLANVLARRPSLLLGSTLAALIAYAAARDHAPRIEGKIVINTVIPGIDPWTKILSDPHIWHFAFDAIPDLPELLVTGHQGAYCDFFVNVLAGNKSGNGPSPRSICAGLYAPRSTENRLRLVPRLAGRRHAK